jgi:hypothetical protein
VRVAFASVRAAPGVTTTAVALACVWPGRVLLVEAAEDGGVLAARFGLAAQPGLMSVAAAARHDTVVEVSAHTQPLPGTDGRIGVLAGPPSVETAGAVWRSLGPSFGRLLDTVDAAVLIDAGRLSAAPATAGLLATVDRLVVVARPRLDELQTLARRLPAVRRLASRVELVLVGGQPYPPGEVAATLQVPVVGVLAHDPHAADALAGVRTRWGLARSRLLRTATHLTGPLTRDTAVSTVGGSGAPASSAAKPEPPGPAALAGGVNGVRGVRAAGGGR